MDSEGIKLDSHRHLANPETSATISKALELTNYNASLYAKNSEEPSKPLYFAFKTFLDAILSAMAIVLLSPVMLLTAIAIKLTSRGPVFFLQERGGLNGKAFTIIKFRTMIETIENGEKKLVKTKIGRFLRKTSLDELPQLFNVFKGDMSLIGPRPHALYEDEEFKPTIRGYRKRFRMKPGITGFAQVAGLRGAIRDRKEIQARVDFDNYYIDNCSTMLDLKILFHTVYIVIKSTNAH